jgi:hypothetical protein
LREAEAIEAVVFPTLQTDRRYDSGVAERIVQDLLETQSRDLEGKMQTIKGEYVEPVQLQVVCSNLCSSVPKTEELITLAHLEKFGQVDEVLGKFYDSALKEVARESGLGQLRLRRWFETALMTPAGTRGTAFRNEYETAGLPNAVADKFESLHVIRADWRAGATWYEITHDRFLRPTSESNQSFQRQHEFRRNIGLGVVILIVLSLAGLGSFLFVRAQHEARNRELLVQNETLNRMKR